MTCVCFTQFLKLLPSFQLGQYDNLRPEIDTECGGINPDTHFTSLGESSVFYVQPELSQRKISLL